MKYTIKDRGNVCDVYYNGRAIIVGVSRWYAEKRVKELTKK
jgi:hypothetical protein